MPYIRRSEVIIDESKCRMPPLIAGSMNNWQYTPMFKIEDFVTMLDSDYVDIIKKMVEFSWFSNELFL